MIIELNGLIKKIIPEKEVNNNLTVQDVVITVDDNTTNPQDILFTLKNEKTVLTKGMEVGMRYKIRCWLNGNEREGKFYIKLVAFEVAAQYEKA